MAKTREDAHTTINERADLARPCPNSDDAKLVQKIDLLVMTYACLTHFINTLDQVNFSNAYISGSKVPLLRQSRSFPASRANCHLVYVLCQPDKESVVAVYLHQDGKALRTML